MVGWRVEELKNWLDGKISTDGKTVFGLEECLEIAKRFNSQYKEYKSNERLLINVAETIRAKIGYKTKVDFTTKTVTVYRDMTVPIQRAITNFVKPEQKPEPEERANNGIKILPVRAEDYLPRNVPEYVQRDFEEQLFMAHLESGIPLLLVGPKGTGKTLAVASFAAKNNIPLIQFDCSENTKRQDLIGRFLLIGDEVVYELGVMPVAIEVANKMGSAILVFEELNALTPQMQKVLNQLLDWRRHVYVPEIGKVYRLNDSCKLLIVGTMNPSYYGGVHELNEDLRSRFAEVFIDYPSENEESRILERISDLDEDLRKLLITLAIETRNGYASGELSYALSTRDLAIFSQVYSSYRTVMGDKQALKFALRNTVVNRYEDSNERKTVMQRIFSIFGVEVW